MSKPTTIKDAIKRWEDKNPGKNISDAEEEGVGDTLEELWISYNFIEKMKGVNVLKKLRVLYMSNNLVKEWSEFMKLQELPALEDLLFVGNPLQESMEETVWKQEATKRLPKLKKLDGEPVLRDEGD
ncbi:LRR 4 domain containing protein [Asbolus verrucosus]|uniref:LRR 4 domain containing protein n=1 Tax=Asbolus verrucosus TaxID=1661398 RepID=A0A482V2A8_ASBVE|nr:LRR 4 domain containing protein [Asbolus verrucosus]